MKKTLICAVTGPSIHSPAVQEMIEKEFGAVPVFLNQNDPDDLDWILGKCHFAVLAGGSDWCPTSTDGEIINGQHLTKFDIPRDKRELHVMNWARNNQKNILGICRGHQGIGLFHKIYLDLDIDGTQVCHSPGGADIKMEGYPCHFVSCFKDYHADFFGRELVNSFHHQALPYWKKAADYQNEDGIEVLGLSYTQLPDSKAKLGFRIIELMRTVDNLWLSCQWHPELDFDKNIASRAVIENFKRMLASNGIMVPAQKTESAEFGLAAPVPA